MEQFKIISEKIDSLSLRERAMLFIGVIAVIFSLWDALLNAPLEAGQKTVIVELNKKNAERLVLSTRLQVLIKQSQEDPDPCKVSFDKPVRQDSHTLSST